ncbi:unnamed protein product [[Actinomadura] parvosata subsp. kistnae]|uniref:Uncharacterized protein n=1 Tax=[Actinomadura] parvosata subsp. kistnae TaxID=1909395 RepID=A0A1U9ZVH7_9ACTN|nr:hypothetical protein [Nonomuraea sp. ATCC 55076]AQZ61966.1 hypothetical protein BKM31_11210 [Nonomuraea sp. ATCC 55076]SPL99878.1 unnamed protein product [Actinomadura parvosata subsp. kistnae]
MDVKQVFDTLTSEEQPPSTVDVGRAVAAGRAVRGRRRAAVAGVAAAVTAAAVLSAWAAQPWQRGDLAAAVPATASASPAPTPRPVYKGFAELKRRYPPKGRIASVPPLVMWVSDAPRKGELFLCESGPNGSSCSGFPPLAAREYGRTQGKLRGRDVWFGVAKDAVHGVTAVTRDGRKLPGTLTRRVAAGLGLWAVEYPRGADVRRLVFTGANGETLQRISS